VHDDGAALAVRIDDANLLHSFRVVAFFTPVLEKVFHVVLAIRIPLFIGRFVLTAFDRLHKLLHTTFFAVVGEFVQHAAYKDENQRAYRRNFHSFLQRAGLLGDRMIVVNQAADNLVSHDAIVSQVVISVFTSPALHTGTRYLPPLVSG